MTIPKASVGIYGEQLLADDNGMIPEENDTYEAMAFAVAPWDPESPVRYADWENYWGACVTAETRWSHSQG